MLTAELTVPRAFREAVLVVSDDPRVRADWARQLDDEGFRVVRCAGPSIVDCAFVERGACPLIAEVRFAVYDERSVTAEWTRALVAGANAPTVIIAADRIRSDGRHEPLLRRVNGARVPLRWALATGHPPLS